MTSLFGEEATILAQSSQRALQWWQEGSHDDWRGSIRIFRKSKDLKGDRATNEWACRIQTYTIWIQRRRGTVRGQLRYDYSVRRHKMEDDDTSNNSKSCRRNDDVSAAHTSLKSTKAAGQFRVRRETNLFVFGEDTLLHENRLSVHIVEGISQEKSTVCRRSPNKIRNYWTKFTELGKN